MSPPPVRPGEYSGRARSEASGTRPVEDVAPDPIQVVLAELRAQRAETARTEGKLSAEIVAVEHRLRSLAQGHTRADLEATQYAMGAVIKRWKSYAAAAVLVAAAAVAQAVTRAVLGESVAQTAAVVAKDAAVDEVAAAEKVHEQTREIAVRSATRIDHLEAKLDSILELLRPPAPAPAPEPKPGRR